MIKVRKRGILLTLSVWSLAAACVWAQGTLWGIDLQRDAPNLFVDYARFKSDIPDQVRLELYYQVFNSGLTYVETQDGWQARYEVLVTIRDKDKRQVTADRKEKEVAVATKARTMSTSSFRTGQFSFDLSKAKYTVEFTLRDLIRKTVINRELNVKLEDMEKGKPSMSDIEFVQAVDHSGDSGSVFGKGELLVIPSVNRTFGGGEENKLLYYVELYRGSDMIENTVIETRLRHANKGMIYRDTLHTELTRPVERQLREISLSDFPAGRYEMEIWLRGRRNKKYDNQRQEFEVLWTQGALLKYDWKKALDQLSYIAGPGELDQLKELEDLQERKTAFVEFWNKRDPTVGTSENEAKREFYRRVYVADRRFSILRREGWRTDRGRIYIQFGQPDEIDDYPYSPNALPYQIWHYYASGPYRRYTFVDERQDGDYRLVYPYDGLHQSPDF